MPVNFTNKNLVWTSILVETLHRLGLKTAVVCPGSRSAPLTIALATHTQIEAIPVLDERSAAFFALGLARQHHLPVALVCTSGTAGANFFPAVIEAYESRVPLLVLTADRPPELRDCNAGQAIAQQRLFGTFTNLYTELALPSLEPKQLAYLRQTVIYAWEQAIYPIAGPVHLNLPFREPLAPLADAATQALALTFKAADFFEAVAMQPAIAKSSPEWMPSHRSWSLPPAWFSAWPAHGVLIAGPAQPADPALYCAAIAQLSQTLQYPVLAEGLSPLRNYADLNPNLITTYDLILRHPTLAAKLAPEMVIRIGEMPTSKQLRLWLETTQPRQWVVDPDGRNLDPLHGKTTHLRMPIAVFAAEVAQRYPTESAAENPYQTLWKTAEFQVRQRLETLLIQTNHLFEGKAAWLLSQVLPPETPLFVSSSMPVRDVEFFWAAGRLRVKPFFNRGANGIDGSLSTALGIAHRQSASIMLTGDLALLHDTNGFLLTQQFVGHLTIVLINNNGGGIFEMLPIARFDPPFEQFFATPQAVDFAKLCATYGVAHESITSWEELAQRLNPLPTSGIRVLELRCDRKADAQWRHQHLNTIAIANDAVSAP